MNMNTILRLAGRPFGLSARSLKVWGNKNPELTEAATLFEKAGDLLNHRRAIVRQMQIDNIKPQSQKRIAK